MKQLEDLVRPNVRAALDRYGDRAAPPRRRGTVALDGIESPYNPPYNRYPDAERAALIQEASLATSIRPDGIFAGHGAGEITDLLLRTFCEPGSDNVIAPAPMHERTARLAALNDVEYRSVALGEDFSLRADALLEAADAHSKIIFIASPNNPTGTLFDPAEIVRTAEGFEGLVVVDESFLGFSGAPSLRGQPAACPNLVVLTSLSAAWASAGLRVALAFARPNVVALLDRIRPAHDISSPALLHAAETLRRNFNIHKWNRLIADERARVMAAFTQLPFCKRVYPSAANFFLAQMSGATRIARYLEQRGIAVKDCSQYAGCKDCLRITIGLSHENAALLAALRNYRPADDETTASPPSAPRK